MGQRVAGVCYVKIDGMQLEVKGSVECPMTETKKEPVMGTAGVAGYKEEPIAPFVKLTAIFTEDFPLETIRTGVDMTVTAELPNGRVYSLSGAELMMDPSVKIDEGEIELEFVGQKGVWQ